MFYSFAIVPGNQPYFHALRKVKIIKDLNTLREERIAGITGTGKLPEKVQFNLFPEGGYLVSGVKSRVAFGREGLLGKTEFHFYVD